MGEKKILENGKETMQKQKSKKYVNKFQKLKQIKKERNDNNENNEKGQQMQKGKKREKVQNIFWTIANNLKMQRHTKRENCEIKGVGNGKEQRNTKILEIQKRHESF